MATSNVYLFFSKIQNMENNSPFCTATDTLGYISGDVCSGFQNHGGCVLLTALIHLWCDTCRPRDRSPSHDFLSALDFGFLIIFFKNMWGNLSLLTTIFNIKFGNDWKIQDRSKLELMLFRSVTLVVKWRRPLNLIKQVLFWYFCTDLLIHYESRSSNNYEFR